LYAYADAGSESAPGDNRIVVPAGKVEHLAALFTRTWQRPPTRGELEGLVDDFVREEVAYREGVAMGLDSDDTIIRRRIRQKLDFVAQDVADRLEPSDEQLQKYLEAHGDEYRVESRLSFQQVFLDPSTHGDDVEAKAIDLAAALQDDPELDASAQGDQTLLEAAYQGVSQREISGLFGEAFAAAVIELEPGKWTAPVKSAFGVHVVRVSAIDAGRPQTLEQARSAVLRDWTQNQRREISEQYYNGLLQKYDIQIDWSSLEPGDED
jgi:parvulin-like peptidyl-prolyl isomerase